MRDLPCEFPSRRDALHGVQPLSKAGKLLDRPIEGFCELGDFLAASAADDARFAANDFPRFARQRNGAILMGVLARRTAQRAVIQEFAPPSEERPIPMEELSWLARILWVSQ